MICQLHILRTTTISLVHGLRRHHYYLFSLQAFRYFSSPSSFDFYYCDSRASTPASGNFREITTQSTLAPFETRRKISSPYFSTSLFTRFQHSSFKTFSTVCTWLPKHVSSCSFTFPEIIAARVNETTRIFDDTPNILNARESSLFLVH